MIKKVKAEELEACAEVIREGFGTVAKDFHLTCCVCNCKDTNLKAIHNVF